MGDQECGRRPGNLQEERSYLPFALASPSADDYSLTCTLYEASTADDCESLRIIRNDCAEYMTRLTTPIDILQQAMWWTTMDRTTMLPMLLRNDGVYIGFGLIRIEDGRRLISGGLVPYWRDKGFGTRLFGSMAMMCGPECWLEVLESNHRAQAVYRKIGFVEVERNSPIITMKRAL